MAQEPRTIEEWMKSVERRLKQALRAGQSIQAVQLARELAAVRDQVDSIDPSAGAVPSAPRELVIESRILTDSQGINYGEISVDFPPVTRDINAKTIKVDRYELWMRDVTDLPDPDAEPDEPEEEGDEEEYDENEEGPEAEEDYDDPAETTVGPPLVLEMTSLKPSLVYSPVREGRRYEVRVRAIARGIPGRFSRYEEILVEKDTTPPPIPSPLQLRSIGATVTATWDGEAAIGGPMSSDFRFNEIAFDFQPDPSNIGGRVDSVFNYYIFETPPQPDDENYGGTWYFRQRSVDSSGNRSDWSQVSQIVPKQLVDEASIRFVVDRNNEALDTLRNDLASGISEVNQNLIPLEQLSNENKGRLDTLNNTTLPGLTTELNQAKGTLANLNDTVIPGINTSLSGVESSLGTLNSTTIPGINSTLSTVQSDVGTLKNTTVPGIRSDLTTLDATMATTQGQLDAVRNTDIPAINTQVSGLSSDLATVRNTTIPDIQSTLGTLNNTTIPGINSTLATTQGQLDEVRNTTIPDIQSTLGTLNNTTIPNINTSLNTHNSVLATLNDVDLPKIRNDLASGLSDLDWKKVGAINPMALRVGNFDNMFLDPTFEIFRDDGISNLSPWVNAASSAHLHWRYEEDNNRRTLFIPETSNGVARDLRVYVGKVSPGDRFTFSFDVATSGSSAGFNIRAQTRSVSTDGINTFTILPNIATNGATQTVTATYVIPANRHELWISFRTESTFAGSIRLAVPYVRRMVDGLLIVNGSIVADHIGALAVTAAKIAANAVTADKISANAVIADKIATNAVTAGKIAAQAITAEKMVIAPGNMVSNPTFANNGEGWTVVSGGIQGGIGPAGQNALRVVAGAAVRGSYLGDGGSRYQALSQGQAGSTYRVSALVRAEAAIPVGGIRLYARLFREPGSASLFATPAFIVNTEAIPANEWTVVQGLFTIPEGSPNTAISIGVFVNTNYTGFVDFISPALVEAAGASLIVAGSVTADSIAANAVTTDKIAANAITAEKIVALGITADRIAASAVTSEKIEALAITGDKIAANAVTASHVQSNTMQTRHMFIGNSDNLWPEEWHGEDARGMYAFNYSTTSTSATSLNRFNAAGATVVEANMLPVRVNGRRGWQVAANAPSSILGFRTGPGKGIPVTPGERYAINVMVQDTVNSGIFAFYIYYINEDGTAGSTLAQGHTLVMQGINHANNDYEGVTFQITVPDLGYNGVMHMVPAVRHTVSATQTGPKTLLEPKIRKMVDGSLVVDGTVSANHLAANSVTTQKIAAGAVTATQIAALTITADQLAANSVTTAKIVASAVTADLIAANSIEAGHITALAVTTDKLAANAVTAAKIAALTITGNEIAGNTITGAKVAANTITAANIAALTITAAELAANSVIAGKIAANAVVAASIAANSIAATHMQANSIGANQIIANSVGATHVQANSMQVRHMFVGNSENLWVEEWHGPGAEGFYAYNGAADTATNATGLTRFRATGNNLISTTWKPVIVNGRRAWQVDPNTSATQSLAFRRGPGKGIPVTPGERYAVNVVVQDSLPSNSTVFSIYFHFYNEDGTVGTTLAQSERVDLRGLNHAPGDTEGSTFQIRVPDLGWDGVMHMAPFFRHAAHSTNTGTRTIFEPKLRKMMDGEFIVDGSIKTNHLSALTITSDKLAANAVTADKIAALSITAGKVASNAITADHIDFGSLNGVMVTGLQIQTHTGLQGVKIDANGIRAFTTAGAETFNVSAANGSITAIGGTFTGALFQSESTSNRGLKLSSAGLLGWDNSGVQSIILNGVNNSLLGGLSTSDQTSNLLRIAANIARGRPGVLMHTGSTSSAQPMLQAMGSGSNSGFNPSATILNGSEQTTNSSGRADLVLEHGGDFRIEQNWGTNSGTGIYKTGETMEVRGRTVTGISSRSQEWLHIGGSLSAISGVTGRVQIAYPTTPPSGTRRGWTSTRMADQATDDFSVVVTVTGRETTSGITLLTHRVTSASGTYHMILAAKWI